MSSSLPKVLRVGRNVRKIHTHAPRASDLKFVPRKWKRQSDGFAMQEVTKLLHHLGCSPETGVPKALIDAYIEESGIPLETTCPRLYDSKYVYDQVDGPTLSTEEFADFYLNSTKILSKVFYRKTIIPEFKQFSNQLESLFEEVRSTPLPTYSANQYNKALSKTLFQGTEWRENMGASAMAFVSTDGQVCKFGDTDEDIDFQAAINPFVYLMALDEYGTDHVHQFIGQEPSGGTYDLTALNNENLPHNPLINAGSIMGHSFIKPDLEERDRFTYIMNKMSDVIGYDPGFSNSTFLGEKASLDRNYCLSYLMQELGTSRHGRDKTKPRKWVNTVDLERHLNLYISSCSMTTNIEGYARLAATLANAGVNVFTGRKIFSRAHVRDALSLMSCCGANDYSGKWNFTVGLPGKTGVSGIIYVAIPGVGGLAVWSPCITPEGNSYRGIKFFEQLISRFNFHVFDELTRNRSEACTMEKLDPRVDRDSKFVGTTACACHLAARGDTLGIKSMFFAGCDLNAGDYDNRTALHLAATNGHLEAVKYLIEIVGVQQKKDRWGATPLDDARLYGHTKVVNYLIKIFGETLDQTAKPPKKSSTPHFLENGAEPSTCRSDICEEVLDVPATK